MIGSGPTSVRTRLRARTIRGQIAAGFECDQDTTDLREAVADAVDFGPRDLASAGDREWLRGAISDCLHPSNDEELEVVAHRLAEAFAVGPGRLGERYDRSHEADELGWD